MHLWVCAQVPKVTRCNLLRFLFSSSSLLFDGILLVCSIFSDFMVRCYAAYCSSRSNFFTFFLLYSAYSGFALFSAKSLLALSGGV